VENVAGRAVRPAYDRVGHSSAGGCCRVQRCRQHRAGRVL